MTRALLAHSLWTLGAAIMLAAFSFYSWVAQTEGQRLRAVLQERRAWRATSAGGLLLVASGFLLMGSARWWERVVWAIVAGVSAYRLWRCAFASTPP